MEILVTLISLVHRIFLLKNDKAIAWITGIIASILSISYFYSIGLHIYAGLEVGFIVLMLYGLVKNKTQKVENIINIFTGIFCLILGYLSFVGVLTFLELVSSITPLMAIYYLTKNKNKSGWVLMVITCIITTFVVFEKGQIIFAIYQVVSLILAIYGLKKSYARLDTLK
ncbi:MAG: nicotinamide mononucleotide transporter [bacterium]